MCRMCVFLLYIQLHIRKQYIEEHKSIWIIRAPWALKHWSLLLWSLIPLILLTHLDTLYTSLYPRSPLSGCDDDDDDDDYDDKNDKNDNVDVRYVRHRKCCSFVLLTCFSAHHCHCPCRWNCWAQGLGTALATPHHSHQILQAQRRPRLKFASLRYCSREKFWLEAVWLNYSPPTQKNEVFWKFTAISSIISPATIWKLCQKLRWKAAC